MKAVEKIDMFGRKASSRDMWVISNGRLAVGYSLPTEVKLSDNISQISVYTAMYVILTPWQRVFF